MRAKGVMPAGNANIAKDTQRKSQKCEKGIVRLETAVDAWECGEVRVIPQGGQLGYWRDATLNRDWYEAAKKEVGMSDVQMPAWLSAIVEHAMRPTDDMGHDESWATPTHIVGALAVEANGDVCSDYASDLVGLLVDEIERLRAQLAAVEKERDEARESRNAWKLNAEASAKACNVLRADRDEAREAARHLLWMQYGDQKPVNTLERWPWLKEVGYETTTNI